VRPRNAVFAKITGAPRHIGVVALLHARAVAERVLRLVRARSSILVGATFTVECPSPVQSITAVVVANQRADHISVAAHLV
jgi:hypothetical protein